MENVKLGGPLPCPFKSQHEMTTTGRAARRIPKTVTENRDENETYNRGNGVGWVKVLAEKAA